MAGGHLVRRATDATFTAPGWAAGAVGFGRDAAVGAGGPAVHTGFGVCALESGGSVPAHVHSYEESVYVLDGAVVLRTDEGAWRLGPGDYGLVPVGTPHSFHNDGGEPARWAELLAPQPRAGHADDTYLVSPWDGPAPVTVDVRDPRVRRFGHIEPAHLDPGGQSQNLLAVSASMRTALLVYSGITVKMMVDRDLGAELATMFMVQYDPDGVAGRHDHPFEETYLFLTGRAEGEFDGERYDLGPGDVAFAGVGCVHAFRNLGDGPLRWLETQAPQPPGRHSYRFARDWEYLRDRLEGGTR
ncbi:cupin domain-containing protein [Rhizomonospora bruguierae]|uniref:cupin domain-containing protein n=1 Tax=Rhizomonospora bruguierae TaxID=1581705 RepID=UPI001BCFBEB3|nr:cupin domain-containing protein [Micromonospora sp. NBRC 107566]